GRQLAQHLSAYRGRKDVLILALPRGGVPVAYEVAKALNVPLDVFLVRKLGVPGHEELAMGAIASGGVRILNHEIVQSLRIPAAVLDTVTHKEQIELERRERAFREGLPQPNLAGKTVIIIDDGLATGATMRAAAQALHALGPARIVVAVPVAAVEACDAFRHEVDEVICAETPEPFWGVGRWYQDFSQTSDAEVRIFLDLARSGTSSQFSS
ncbi:MAG: phosphoribosyltransferase, partial [Candidatus Sericytochromatia bacterium]